MTTLIQQRIEAARRQGPIRRSSARCLPVGLSWEIPSFCRGYSILLADPVLPDLNALDQIQRSRFLLDMATLGDALLETTDAFRINYEILGNTDAALHAHIFPRYMSEPEELRRGPVWYYEQEYRQSIKFDLVRDRN